MAVVNDVAVQLGQDGTYRIRQGTAFSDDVELGEPIEWRAPNGKTYISLLDMPEGEEEASAVETPFECFLYEVRAMPGEIEEVEFEGDGEEGEDGEGEEEDGEEL